PAAAVAWPSAASWMTQPEAASCQRTRSPWTWCAMTCAANSGSAARNRRQRPMVACTGVLDQSPRSNGSLALPRAVIPALTPKRSRHPGTSQSGGSALTSSSSVLMALDGRAEIAQPLIDTLVAALNLADVVDGTDPVGRERRHQHRHPGANVGRFHSAAVQPSRPADHRPMRITENNPGAHADQLVDKEQ